MAAVLAASVTRGRSHALITTLMATRVGSTTAVYDTAMADEQPIDGLLYSNAHNGESALALYERAEAAIHCAAELPLAADELRSRLLVVANDHAMTMVSSGF